MHRFFRISFLAGAFLLASCGSGGGNIPSVPPIISLAVASSLFPPDGMEGVDPDAVVGASFSIPMDASSLNAATFALFHGLNQVPGTVAYDGARASFAPSQTLSSKVNYRAVLSGQIRDSEGHILGSDIEWSFTTQDYEAPELLDFHPWNGQPYVSVHPAISAAFSEPVQLTGINSIGLRLMGPNGPIPAYLEIAGSVANLVVLADLDQSTTYTALLDAGIVDMAGNPVEPFSWAFSTTEFVAPTIVGTSPGAGQGGISIDSSIQIFFSEPIDCGSLSDSSFSLSDQHGAPVLFTTSCANATVTLFPSGLDYLSSYTTTVSAGIRDLAGNVLASPYSWSFTTLGLNLPPAQKIELDNTGAAQIPRVAVSPDDGVACAVWRQKVDTDGNGSVANNPFSLYSNLYVPGVGWGTAALVETDDLFDVDHSQIAFNPQNGEFFCVWKQKAAGDATVRIYFSKRSAAGAWSLPLPISDATNDSAEPRIAVSSTTDAMWVSWLQNNVGEGFTSAKASRLTTAGGWEGPVLIENAAGIVGPVEMAFDTAGSAYAFWRQQNPANTRYSAYLNGAPTGAPWSPTPLLVETDESGNVEFPQIAPIISDSGGVMLCWSQYVSAGGGGDAWKSIYAARTVFEPSSQAFLTETPAPIETGTSGDAAEVDLASSPSGTVVAIWLQLVSVANGGDGKISVYANRWTPAAGWGTPQTLESANTEASLPQIAPGPAGRYFATWRQKIGATNFHIFGSSLNANGFWWGVPAALENNTASAGAPSIAVDGAGTATVVWNQPDPTIQSIWAQRFP